VTFCDRFFVEEAMTLFRFRLSTLLLLIVVIGLSIALIIAQRRITKLEAAAATTRPLSVREVAQQFEKYCAIGALTVQVTDCRYSTKQNVYDVEFSWANPNTKQRHHASVSLWPYREGKYSGTIQSDEFVEAFSFNRVTVEGVLPAIQ
jgi:hypothetical protein